MVNDQWSTMAYGPLREQWSTTTVLVARLFESGGNLYNARRDKVTHFALN